MNCCLVVEAAQLSALTLVEMGGSSFGVEEILSLCYARSESRGTSIHLNFW